MVNRCSTTGKSKWHREEVKHSRPTLRIINDKENIIPVNIQHCGQLILHIYTRILCSKFLLNSKFRFKLFEIYHC